MANNFTLPIFLKTSISSFERTPSIKITLEEEDSICGFINSATAPGPFFL